MINRKTGNLDWLTIDQLSLVTLAKEIEAETKTEAQNSKTNSVKNAYRTEENKPFRSLLFRLRFTAFAWNFVLPSLSPLPSSSLV